MPRHSHILYEFYVRVAYTIFGCLLTSTALATFAHHNIPLAVSVINIINVKNRDIPILETVAVSSMIKYLSQCIALGIFMAIMSAVVTYVLIWRHIDAGIVLICIIHLGIDSIITVLALTFVPTIVSTSMGVTESI